MSEQRNETAVPSTPEDRSSTTRHTVTVNGQELSYTVTAGRMVLREEIITDGKFEGEKARAEVFYVAYTLDGVQDAAQRPVTFSFNGGPGSSSVWLHLGVLGPRRVQMGDAGELTGPPYRLVENEFTLLDRTDLVFIDPVSTGFSRAAQGEKPGEFHGFQKDIESVGDFIRLFVTREQRWLSPKFLIGESYGTTRAGGLSGYLQDRHGLFLNGVMLVSSILDFGTVDFSPGHDLPYVLHLPTYTATAFFHGKLAPDLSGDLQATLREAEEFAAGEYARALFEGTNLNDGVRDDVARKLARLTGLSEEYLLRVNLRPEIMRFCKELLRDQELTVGRLDARFTGFDRDAGGERVERDPSLSAITGPYSAAMNHYVRADLRFELDLPYEILTPKVRPWSYREFENRHVSTADTLRAAIATNPHLKVLVASGYYDLATPYFATEHTLAHLALPPGLRQNVRTVYYEAGHMMYVHLPSLAQQKADLAAFLEWATA